MNPQAALTELRELCRDILGGPPGVTRDAELAALFSQLDEWIMGGGTMPRDWFVAQVISANRRTPRHQPLFMHED